MATVTSHYKGQSKGSQERAPQDNEAEEKLRYLAMLTQSIADAVIGTDAGYNIISWNEGAQKLYGWQADEVLGKSTFDILPTEFPGNPNGMHDAQEALATQGHWRGEVVQRRKDGSRVDISASVATVLDEHGNITAGVAVNRDISERKAIETAQAQLSAIVESTADAIYTYDFEGTILTWNKGAEDLYGYTAAEIIGRKSDTITPPDRRGEVLDVLVPAIKAGESVRNLETVRMRRDGSRFDALLTASPIRDAMGKPTALSIIVRYITERKIAEEELFAANAKFESVFNQSGIFAGIVDLDGNLREANELAVHWCGYTREEVLNKPFWETPWWRGSEEMKDRIRAATRQAASGSVFRDELHYWLADGTERIVDFAMHPIRDHEGAVRFLHPNGIDITERRRLEQRKDEFIALASHELKTPITALKLSTQLLQRHLQKAETAAQGLAHDTSPNAGDGITARQLSRMNEQLNKLTELVNDLLDVSKIEAGKLDYHMQEVDFDTWLGEYVEDLRPLSEPQGIVLTRSGTGTLVFDTDRIGQVLTNFITNAIKYSPSSERIIVTGHIDDGGARVGVQDFGIGIPESDLERVFDRFYQSHGGGSSTGSYPGLGLGLYISAQIVKRHGGRIWVESEQGKGSTFYFELPAGNGSRAEHAEA